MREHRAFLIGLVVIVLLSPLGLYLPHLLKAGGAWGEWSLEEVDKTVGYEPAGMKKRSDTWKAPMPDYARPGQEKAPLRRLGLSYIFSAVIGVTICGGGAYLLARWLAPGKNRDADGKP